MGNSSAIFGKLYAILVVHLSILTLSQAYKFYVGGRDGWVVKPSENYNHWAERNRFQVNDTLYFKYNKENESVLLVTKENYYKCNTKDPIQALMGGESEFKFERSGPFFFISSDSGHCFLGQKLIVVVMAVRPKRTLPSPIPPPPASGSDPPAAHPGLEPSVSGPGLSPMGVHWPAGSSAASLGGSVGLVLCVSIGVGAILGRLDGHI